MSDDRIIRLVRRVVADEMAGLARAEADGIVDQVEAGKASVRLAGPSSAALPGFTFPPYLDVQPGDHVQVYRRGGYQLITAVLNRDAILHPDPPVTEQISYPDSPAGAADYLARMYRDGDTEPRISVGIDASNRGSIGFGSGAAAADAFLRRTATGELAATDVLAVGQSTAAMVLRFLIEREWRFEQRSGTSGSAAALQLRSALGGKSFHIAANDGTIIATFRDENGAADVRLSFFGATPQAKPAITGSRGGNAALASLLTELQDYGLITNSTT